jgi:hypothetical protein
MTPAALGCERVATATVFTNYWRACEVACRRRVGAWGQGGRITFAAELQQQRIMLHLDGCLARHSSGSFIMGCSVQSVMVSTCALFGPQQRTRNGPPRSATRPRCPLGRWPCTEPASDDRMQQASSHRHRLPAAVKPAGGVLGHKHVNSAASACRPAAALHSSARLISRPGVQPHLQRRALQALWKCS